MKKDYIRPVVKRVVLMQTHTLLFGSYNAEAVKPQDDAVLSREYVSIFDEEEEENTGGWFQ